VSGLQHYQYDYGILTQTWMILLNCMMQVITQNWLVILCIHSLIFWEHVTYKNNVNITFQNDQQLGGAHFVKPYVMWWLQTGGEAKKQKIKRGGGGGKMLPSLLHRCSYIWCEHRLKYYTSTTFTTNLLHNVLLLIIALTRFGHISCSSSEN
jgi:hypothetical protein